ncbi:MAG: hypothetical protein AAGH88_00325 [Planctomycetota bacterium]
MLIRLRSLALILTGLVCLLGSDYAAAIYDPGTGRFLQRDPAGYPDGMNAYGAYHVMRGGVDPRGLNEVQITETKHYSRVKDFWDEDRKNIGKIDGKMDYEVAFHAARLIAEPHCICGGDSGDIKLSIEIETTIGGILPMGGNVQFSGLYDEYTNEFSPSKHKNPEIDVNQDFHWRSNTFIARMDLMNIPCDGSGDLCSEVLFGLSRNGEEPWEENTALEDNNSPSLSGGYRIRYCASVGIDGFDIDLDLDMELLLTGPLEGLNDRELRELSSPNDPDRLPSGLELMRNRNR